MTFKEIFHINNLFNKIKLDHSDSYQNLLNTSEYDEVHKRQDEKFPENEWNQEYELIYLSYVLEQ
ncbi:MAG: hypothetical protein IH618_16370 [Ignavibacteriaceae bacterium]|nr:hypothetical protein [Ignavibacteriaceae bacterium]